jgi:hypothetical protein
MNGFTFCEACSRQELHDSLRPDRYPASGPSDFRKVHVEAAYLRPRLEHLRP